MAISSYSAFNQFNQPACRQAGKAFTIVELLVVFAITAILFTSLVFYSRSAERQVILFKEQMKVITALQKAKSLAISAFGENQAPCGFGVNFDKANNRMTIFKELPALGNDSCSTKDNVYTSSNSNEFYEEIKLDSRTVKFGSLVNSDNGPFSNIVYISPEPLTIIDNLSSEFATIEITDISGANKRNVKVTDAGQITAITAQ